MRCRRAENIGTFSPDSAQMPSNALLRNSAESGRHERSSERESGRIGTTPLRDAAVSTKTLHRNLIVMFEIIAFENYIILRHI